MVSSFNFLRIAKLSIKNWSIPNPYILGEHVNLEQSIVFRNPVCNDTGKRKFPFSKA